jgi:uncharacterized membrane protein YoaK (UPF0700 family)
MILACNFGYVDCISFARFGLFVCSITANIVNLMLSLVNQQFHRALFVAVALISTSFIGTILSCFVAWWVNNRRLWYWWVCGMAIVGGLVVDLYEHFTFSLTPPSNDDQYIHPTPYLFLFRAIPFGAMIHWALKTPYITMLMTINNQKVSEALFRFSWGLDQGDSKMRGDVVTFFLILMAFTVGAIIGAVYLRYARAFATLPSIAMMLVTGVLVSRSDPEWMAWFDSVWFSCFKPPMTKDVETTVDGDAAAAVKDTKGEVSPAGTFGIPSMSAPRASSFKGIMKMDSLRRSTFVPTVQRVTIYERLRDDFDIFASDQQDNERDSSDDDDDSDDGDDSKGKTNKNTSTDCEIATKNTTAQSSAL